MRLLLLLGQKCYFKKSLICHLVTDLFFSFLFKQVWDFPKHLLYFRCWAVILMLNTAYYPLFWQRMQHIHTHPPPPFIQTCIGFWLGEIIPLTYPHHTPTGSLAKPHSINLSMTHFVYWIRMTLLKNHVFSCSFFSLRTSRNECKPVDDSAYFPSSVNTPATIWANFSRQRFCNCFGIIRGLGWRREADRCQGALAPLCWLAGKVASIVHVFTFGGGTKQNKKKQAWVRELAAGAASPSQCFAGLWDGRHITMRSFRFHSFMVSHGEFRKFPEFPEFPHSDLKGKP